MPTICLEKNAMSNSLRGTCVYPLTLIKSNGETYTQKVEDIRPADLFRYWVLSETVGATAADASSFARVGTYAGVTLDSSTSEDGLPSGLWTTLGGSTVNIDNNLFADGFDSVKGAMMIHLKVFNVGVWTDTNTRTLLDLRSDVNNRISISKTSDANGFIRFAYRGQSINAQINEGASVDTGWRIYIFNWDSGTNKTEAFANGVSINTSTANAWAAPAALTGNIGSNSGVALNWHGYINHVAFWNGINLTQPEVTSLSTV